MNIRLWSVLLALPGIAGITYDTSKANTVVENTAIQINKATETKDLSGVNARLRIEGAHFRPFNLYLVNTTTAKNSTAADKRLSGDIHQVIERDLKIVHGFNFLSHQKPLTNSPEALALLKQEGAEGISSAELTFTRDLIFATIEHKNLVTGKRSLKSFSANRSGYRKLSHLLAQSIYEEFIGPEDIFLLQIAAVKRDGNGSQIVLLDFDGTNETAITDGPWRKSSPYFSPDGKSILYTVISSTGQGIVEQKIGSKEMQFRTKKPGLNLDARVFPNNSGMLLTLSFGNMANVYRTLRDGTVTGKLTNSLGVNLSPTISPDGREFVFVSERGGTPQIYVQQLEGIKAMNAKRLTFQGKYNQTPHYSPDGKYIAFTGRDERNAFDIFLIEKPMGKTFYESADSTKLRVSRVTEHQGRNQEPYFSPSGRFIIFTSERDGRSKPDIFIASLNGDHQFRLTDATAQKSLGYYSPVIRPGIAPLPAI